MFELNWQEFSRRPNIARLPMHEQMRQFQLEQYRHEMLIEYVTSAAVGFGGNGAGGGNSFVVQQIQANRTQDASQNSYVVDDYVDNYFE